MSHVPLDTTDRTEGATELAQIREAFGTEPAMFRAVANSPAALRSMWGSFGALGSGTLGAALGEQIAVAVANRNSCDYCLAAHTALGRKAGLSAEQLTAAQVGESADERVAALLRFALALVDRRGAVSAGEIQEVRAHGWGDEEIVETIAHVALNIFTNYVNIALDVPVDFAPVRVRTAAAA